MPGPFEWTWADTTARNAEQVSQLQIGLRGRVLSGSGIIYTAIAAGSGSSCWSTLEASIAATIQSDLDAAEADIATLQSDLDTAEATIGDHTTELADHETRIDVLENL